MTNQLILAALILGAGLLVLAFGLRAVRLRQKTQARLAQGPRAVSEPSTGPYLPERGVGRWLFLAGYRGVDSPAVFWWRTTMCLILGIGVGIATHWSGVFSVAEEALRGIPGNVGWLFLPPVIGGPFILALLLGLLPYVAVQRARRARVQSIERDLANLLELLASLTQAGLGFDAAIARILEGIPADRPVAEELRIFQTEVLAGGSRVGCLGRLSERVAMPRFSTLTSALIQAERLGSSTSGTLRGLADDARNASRERALMLAQALPAKLVFPLVICFLPGIFVMTLGPAFFDFIQGTAEFG